MIKAIVFDFDGVLADTFDIAVGICRELAIDFTLDDFRDHHNGNVYEQPKLAFDRKQVDEYIKLYRERAKGENLFPLKSRLQELNRRYRLFVISSNGEEAIGEYLRRGGWDGLFDRVYGLESDRSKVKKFHRLFTEYGYAPAECLFVTDTLGDIIEGKTAGVRTLAVTWGYHGEMRLKKGRPDAVIHGFADLIPAVERLDGDK